VTGLDRFEARPGARDGYWPSPGPAECGGNRRQKAALGRLDAVPGAPAVASRRNGRWNVMFVEREPDQWYQGGSTLTRLEPESLQLVGAPLVLPEGSRNQPGGQGPSLEAGCPLGGTPQPTGRAGAIHSRT
jgi:hypothetical protein